MSHATVVGRGTEGRRGRPSVSVDTPRVALVLDEARFGDPCGHWHDDDRLIFELVADLDEARDLAVDIVVIDSRLIDLPMLALLGSDAGGVSPILALAAEPKPFEARFLFEAGIAGYVPASTSAKALAAIARLVQAGERYLPAALIGALAPDAPPHRVPGGRPFSFRRVRDADGNISFPFVSPTVEGALGLTPDAITADPERMLDTVHPDDVGMLQEFAEQSADRVEDYAVEHRCVLGSGGVQWRRAYFHTRRAADGGIEWDGISFDITAERAAQEALVEPATPAGTARIARLETLNGVHALAGFLDRLPAGLYHSVYDDQARPRLVQLNRKMAELLGFGPEQVVTEAVALLEQMHPEDRRAFLETIRAIGPEEQTTDIVYRIRLPSGETRWLRNVSRRRRRSSGDVVCDGAVIDVTEMKTLEARLHASEDRIAAITANLPCILFRREFDRDGRRTHPFLGFGATMEARLGLSSRDALADPTRFSALVHPEDRARLLAHTKDCAARLAPQDITYRILTAAGEVRWLHSVAHHWRAADGRTVADGIMLDVTEQKRLEQQLQAIVRNLPGMVFRRTFSRRGDWYFSFITYNDELTRLHGASPADALVDQSRLLDRVHPDDRADHIAAIARSAARLVPIDREFRMITADGGIVWRRMIAQTWRDANGEIVADGITIDITAQKELEARLRESEARFAAIVANLPGAIYRATLTPDGTGPCTYMSPGVADLLGFPAESFVDRIGSLRAHVLAEDAAAYAAAWAESARTLRPFDFTYRMRSAGGRLCFVRNLARLHREPDGRVLADGIMLDVTRELLAEARLHESEAQLAIITRNLPVALYRWRIDPDGREHCLYVSEGIEDLLGVSAADLVADAGLLQRAVMAFPDQPAVAHARERVAARSEIEDEFRAKRADGGECWLRIHARPSEQLDGALLYDGVVIDVTERRLIAEQLARRNHELLMLCRVSRIALESPNLVKGLRQIVGEVARFMHECQVSVALFDEAEQSVEFRATTKVPMPGRRVPLGETLSWEVIRTGQPVVIERGGRCRPERRFSTLRAMGEDSFVGYPIRVAGRCIGSFNVSSAHPLEIDRAQAELLASYADYVASFIAARGLDAPADALAAPVHPTNSDVPAAADGAAFDAAYATRLTSRQRDVLWAIAEGLSNEDIAARLDLRVPTVKVHVRAVLKALDVKNRTQAAVHVQRNGLGEGPRRRGRRRR